MLAAVSLGQADVRMFAQVVGPKVEGFNEWVVDNGKTSIATRWTVS